MAIKTEARIVKDVLDFDSENKPIFSKRFTLALINIDDDANEDGGDEKFSFYKGMGETGFLLTGRNQFDKLVGEMYKAFDRKAIIRWGSHGMTEEE